jgi:hypothetical protein
VHGRGEEPSTHSRSVANICSLSNWGRRRPIPDRDGVRIRSGTRTRSPRP